jgi:hypothetical protein
MNQEESDKLVARAIARNRSIDPETRLALARKFDPNVKLNEGAYEDSKRYQESIITTHGKKAPDTKTKIIIDRNGDMTYVQTKGDEVISYTEHKKKKNEAKPPS